ncbi:MarR family winged helix-turn-helix transcriptional regulator [Nocardia sp. NBC_00881]|uniref:MarR family winged helix-turn-helix transcriptional regulator n=1 Tax=Nocardia sp. NBC_00881 TaxID=2975995 RepID=UPI003863479A|nr:MarR family winged helix-turn-helix transcriptional regulator [Nocardia sp. NBC_00881]
MSTDDPSLLKLLSQATAAYERALNRELRARLDDQLRPAHYAVFRHLNPAGARITALAEAAGMTQQSMGELVTHLERCGLVTREVDPADRRARVVMVTEAGRTALGVASERIRGIERTLAQALGECCLAELRTALAQLDRALTQSAGVG